MFYFEDTTGCPKADDDDSLVFLARDPTSNDQTDSEAVDETKVDEAIFERIRQMI
jgi:hypothetical protein